LIDRHPGLQSARQTDRSDCAVQKRSTRNITNDRYKRERHGDVDLQRQPQSREAGRRHAHDGEGLALDADGATDSGGVAIEVPSPERVPDDRDRRGLRSVEADVGVGEDPAGDGPNPEFRKVVAGDRGHIAARSDIVNLDVDYAVRGPANEGRQALLPFGDRPEHRQRERPVSRRRCGPCERDERGGIAYRQVAQHEGVQDGEDCGVGADGERQRQDRAGGENRRLPESPDCQPHILNQLAHASALSTAMPVAIAEFSK
jgi:hypothetical protein